MFLYVQKHTLTLFISKNIYIYILFNQWIQKYLVNFEAHIYIYTKRKKKNTTVINYFNARNNIVRII